MKFRFGLRRAPAPPRVPGGAGTRFTGRRPAGSGTRGGGFACGERGIGLFEVMAGTLVATLAVLGLAYSFGIGRALIDRYQVARAALGRAQFVVDSLVTQSPSALVNGTEPFWVESLQAGTTVWTVGWVDDPADRLAGSAPPDPTPNDMKRISVEVRWRLGGRPDTLRMSRLVLGT